VFSPRATRQLARLLGRLPYRLRLSVWGQEGDPFFEQLREVAAGLCRARPQDLAWEWREHVGPPRLEVSYASGEPTGLSFYGSVAGYQFQGLLGGLREAGRTKPTQVERERQILVFSTPTCPECSRILRAAQRWALAGRRIQAAGVDASAVPSWAEHFGVEVVPTTVMIQSDGAAALAGALPLRQWQLWVERVWRGPEGESGGADYRD
jgi:hypothetical protein